MRHIIAQIVKAKFVIGAVGNVRVIGVASCSGIGLMQVNTIHAHAVEFKNRGHPGTVPFGQIIVYGDQVYPMTCQSVEVDRQGSDQGFSLTRLHFSDLALMQCDSTDKLNVVMDHVPSHLFARSIPAVGPMGLVAR